MTLDTKVDDKLLSIYSLFFMKILFLAILRTKDIFYSKLAESITLEKPNLMIAPFEVLEVLKSRKKMGEFPTVELI